MNAAMYLRVSTDDQVVETQLAALVRRAEEMGLTVQAGHVYADRGVSGATDSRPEFNRLRQDIKTRAFEVVLVTKLDRIARSARAALEFFDGAEASDVRVIVTEQAIDTGTPAGRLTRTILAGVAEFEGELIRDRTRAAMAAFRTGARKTKSGRPVGRPVRVTQEKVRTIERLRSEGLPWKQIAGRVALPAETCRRASWLLKRRERAVGNSVSVTNVPSPPSEGPR